MRRSKFLLAILLLALSSSELFAKSSKEVVIYNLAPDSVVTVESSTGEKVRTLLYVNGQNELRIADLDASQKYSLLVKDPTKAQAFKIENVETGAMIRLQSSEK